MVQLLSQTPGFTSVSPSIIQQNQPAEAEPLTQDPSLDQGPTPLEKPAVAADVSEAAAVHAPESQDSPSQASDVKPSEQQVDFFSQLGSVLSGLLSSEEDQPEDVVAKAIETPEPPVPQTPEAQQEIEHVMPELKGYKSVVAEVTKPDTKKPTSPTSNSFLDLIGKAEGTDKGRGYNESLAYGSLTGGPKDLVNMTLDEIDQLQGRMLRHPANKWNSSALGRYQIVRRTLRTFRGAVGLKGSDKFSPENQDKLAMAILAEQGPGAWEGLKRPEYWEKAKKMSKG